MNSSARLNGLSVLENGKHAFSAFVPMDIQTATMSTTVHVSSSERRAPAVGYRGPPDAMQFMLDRRSIATALPSRRR